jgi:transposase-like protein
MSARRNFTAEFKAKIVLELISGEKGLTQANREYGIKDTVLSRWKQEFLTNASQLFEQPKEVQKKEVRIAELERMVGRLTMQLELSHLPWRAVSGKKVLSYANSPLRDKE